MDRSRINLREKRNRTHLDACKPMDEFRDEFVRLERNDGKRREREKERERNGEEISKGSNLDRLKERAVFVSYERRNEEVQPLRFSSVISINFFTALLSRK